MSGKPTIETRMMTDEEYKKYEEESKKQELFNELKLLQNLKNDVIELAIKTELAENTLGEIKKLINSIEGKIFSLEKKIKLEREGIVE